MRDDLRRVTSRRWSLERARPDGWLLTSPYGSGALQLDPAVDEEALPPGIGAEEVQQEFVDEALQHVGDRVVDALADHGMALRCRAHAAPLTVCAGRWVCDSRAAHDVADVGSLRRGHAEVIASSDS
ncbi:hypothetical protein [Klenkia taihuensis]|uniref:Uncharacterized protein n=1 Tax=Klenkia taihuensis TaxID=1225127 RepID=A0A1I1QCR4_9ACTN|nr:hypothetical protein [Klenkia taihuensis]GHE08113.1 hypothetical protein GCM10011381_07440 [Klenkia taihuensis]SFD17618.1 hypothetical protein SAMN05661030_2627 [Klenkia taihuensis]